MIYPMNNAMHQDPISNLKSGSHYPNRFNLVSKDSGLQDFCTSLRVCPQGVERKQEKCATTDARNRLELVHRIHGLPLLAMRNSFEIRVRDRMIRMRGVTTSFEKLTPASQTAGLLHWMADGCWWQCLSKTGIMTALRWPMFPTCGWTCSSRPKWAVLQTRGLPQTMGVLINDQWLGSFSGDPF
jgi:hypothetical protein